MLPEAGTPGDDEVYRDYRAWTKSKLSRCCTRVAVRLSAPSYVLEQHTSQMLHKGRWSDHCEIERAVLPTSAAAESAYKKRRKECGHEAQPDHPNPAGAKRLRARFRRRRATSRAVSEDMANEAANKGWELVALPASAEDGVPKQLLDLLKG